MIGDLEWPLVLQKLMEYAGLLVTRDGRVFYLAHQNLPHLALHPWQDMVSIFTAFAKVGADSTLYKAVMRGYHSKCVAFGSKEMKGVQRSSGPRQGGRYNLLQE